jgi:hypothetical protein
VHKYQAGLCLSNVFSSPFGNISNLREMLSALDPLHQLFSSLLDLVEKLMTTLKLARECSRYKGARGSSQRLALRNALSQISCDGKLGKGKTGIAAVSYLLQPELPTKPMG